MDFHDPFSGQHHHNYHTTLFNPPDPSANNDFTYDFKVRGTDRHHRRGHQIRHHEDPAYRTVPKIHRVDPRGKKEEGGEAADPVHDIVLGPTDTLFPRIDGSQNSKEKQHAQDRKMTNGITMAMDSAITDKAGKEKTKNQDGQEGKQDKIYVRGMGNDEVANDGVGQNSNDKTQRQEIEEDTEDLQKRQDQATERQRLDDEITEIKRMPTDPAKNSKSKAETTSKVNVTTKEVPETKEAEETKETTKAKSKPRIMMTRIKARFMKTVEELRK
ncbi:uncharacterized protein KD926_007131 [Aspergillus affinis]|uniref:uncharacterized protein n=1 Tax=Aspergillus affinis TaxID=1070780 RepID=UPI0022FDE3C5|nr:uncharacterized protein KD926_007131 [Aspergillus affinis]KAI9045828.1 hypothetical protein KD926_007131 [Aspergillus affinis]